MRNRKYVRGRKQICPAEILKIPRRCRERFLTLEAPHLLPLHEAGVCFAGAAVLGSGYHIRRFDPRWHSLIYTFAGGGRLETGGREHVLHPGALYVAPAHLPHEYWISDPPWNVAWFCMEERNGFHCAPAEPQVLVSSSFSLVSSIVQQLTDDPPSAARSQPEILEHCVQLLLTILRHDTESSRESLEQQQKRRLDSAFLAVHRDPSFGWTVGALVEHGHLPFGEDRLRQLCVKIYGRTPMRRVRAIRMQIAQELLRATDYPLRTIAPMVGYTNEFAFSTAFTRELGRSPRDYRQVE